MRQLWTKADDAALERFRVAAARGALVPALHAVEGATATAVDQDLAAFATWGERIARAQAAVPPGSPAGLAGILAQVLHGDLGFEGDVDDYDNPDNSRLHRVIKRRRGLPILLSVVWMEVGSRGGIPVAGIGLPGHFIVRVGGTEGVLADPFGGGRVLTRDECADRVRRLSDGSIELRDEMLREAHPVAILERVLQNLLGSCTRRHDDGGRFRAATFLAALRPDSPERLLQNADVAGELGLPELATRLLREVLEKFPDAEEAEAAAERLDSGGSPLVN